MTNIDPAAINRLRAVAGLLREPESSDLAQILDAVAGVLPPVAELPEAIRYRLVLDDLVARIQAQDPPAALPAWIEHARGGEEAVTSSEQAALEGARAATETIREALAESHPDSGLVWMFGMAEVCAKVSGAESLIATPLVRLWRENSASGSDQISLAYTKSFLIC